MELSPVNPDVRARIISAIEELYDQLGRVDKFPTVSDVRGRARADMNTCSAVFKEWKRQQTAKPALVAVAVPDQVKSAHLEAVGIVWTAAQEQANASLREAEAKWELERGDNETMRRELAEAYEGAVADAEQARSSHAEVQRSNDLLTQQNQQLSQQLAEARESLAEQTTRAVEIERRANDLKDELRVAHEETAAVRQELSQARISHLAELDQQKGVAAEQIERLNENLVTARARLESVTEQAEERQMALGDTQVKLAQAQAQAEAANEELVRVRAALDVKQQQADGLQLQVATLGAQHAELQRSHTTLQADAEKWRQAADENSRELAKTTGGLQEVLRQNSELMTRLSPTKSRHSSATVKPSAGKTDEPK